MDATLYGLPMDAREQAGNYQVLYAPVSLRSPYIPFKRVPPFKGVCASGFGFKMVQALRSRLALGVWSWGLNSY